MSRRERVLVKNIHATAAVLLAARGHAETYFARIQFCDALEALRNWANNVSNQDKEPEAALEDSPKSLPEPLQ